MTVKFTNSKAKNEQIKRIVDRWFAALRVYNITPDYDKLNVQMDLSAVVAQKQVRLDLDKLERFGDFDFAHDMSGIINCIDRKTGLLQHCFLPRAARPHYEGSGA
jgi:hypothetical protein